MLNKLQQFSVPWASTWKQIYWGMPPSLLHFHVRGTMPGITPKTCWFCSTASIKEQLLEGASDEMRTGPHMTGGDQNPCMTPDLTWALHPGLLRHNLLLPLEPNNSQQENLFLIRVYGTASLCSLLDNPDAGVIFKKQIAQACQQSNSVCLYWAKLFYLKKIIKKKN